MLGFAHNHPSGTFRVQTLTTGAIVCRRYMKWHPKESVIEEQNNAGGEERTAKSREGNGPGSGSGGEEFGSTQV